MARSSRWTLRAVRRSRRSSTEVLIRAIRSFSTRSLLQLDGMDLTGEPLLKRRALLPRVLDGSGLLPSQELPGTVAAIVEAVRGLGLEGVIAKRKDSLYEPGERSDAWQKLKLENQQEFVIGGYRPGSNGIDALLVGYYDDSGLRFAGKVRAGFVPHLRREVFKALKPHHVDDCPSSICRTRRHPAGAAA